jgi:iron complex outermembrane receptor protein
MKKFALLFWLFILSDSSVIAQAAAQLSGKITDDKGQPVEGVSVHLLNTNTGTISNAQGNFFIEHLYPGNYTLQASAIGFATVKKEVSVSEVTGSITITLNPTATRLDEVVVSAQKEEAWLQQLPASVTALTARQVQEYRLWNSKELTAIAPGLYAADPGDKRNVTSIRGITSTSYDPAVATYIDGVNQFGLDTYIVQLFDVERIEVLRGPQGTLYGRNAMGGVINIITKQPDNKTSGFAETDLGNYAQQRYSAGLRTPLIKNKLFFGAAGLFEHTNGFYTNDFNYSRFDKQRSVVGNYYLKYLPNTLWAFTVNAKHNHNGNKGPFPLMIGVEEALAHPFHTNQNAVTKMMDNTVNASLSANYAGPCFHFSSQTSYQSNNRYYTDPVDGDFSPLDVITIINNYGKDRNKVKVVTQEFKFSSPAASAAHWKWVAGTYLFYQDNPVKLATHFGEDAGLLGVPDKNFSLINTTKGKTSGLAVYAQTTYTVSKKLEATAGMRYDHEYKKQRIRGEYQHDPDPEPMFAYRTDTAATVNYSAFSPKLSFVYHVAEHNNLYATYSKGYRTGGLTPLSSDPSQPPLYAYKPEYSNNYEAGIKNTFLQERLLINVAAFYTAIHNAQVPTLILPDAVTITKNTGSLVSKGVELEAAATPLKGLELNYGFGYTEATYKKLKLAQNGTVLNLEGKRQLFTPELTSMLAAQYGYNIGGSKNRRVVLRGEWKYLGKQFFDLANKIAQNPYHLLNARLGITTKNLEVMLWGRNLADKKYISYAYDFGAVRLGDPKNYGVSFLIRF